MISAGYVSIDGADAYVECWGQGHPVLCLHTAGQSGVQWRHAAPELARIGYKAIVPDLPGHGRSDPAPQGPITDLSVYTNFCAKVIDELQLERPLVAGCSIGGKIAIDLAINHGHRLAAVVAMAADAGLPPKRSIAMTASLRRELQDSAAPSRSDRTYLGTRAVVGRSVPRARVDAIALMHRREDPVVSISDLIGWASFDRWSRLAEVGCPIHLVVGADDLWVESTDVRRTANAIPGALFTQLEGIGHYPMEELPDIATRLHGWFTEIAGDASK